MRRLLYLLALIPVPLWADGHDNHPRIRTHPELSDLALVVMAALGIWLVRRAMRARFAARSKDDATRH